MNTDVIKTTKLDSGKHTSFESGACIMELVSYVAGEPWSDHPKCACPVLTDYAIRLNDSLGNRDRQRLKPIVKKILNTNDGNSKKRSDYLVLQSITVFLPLLTDALKLKKISSRLRKFKKGEWIEARDYINSVREEIRSSYAANAANAASAASAANAAYAAAYAAANAAANAAASAAYAAANAAASAAASAANAAANAANAAASAAANAAKKSKSWLGVKRLIVTASINTLKHACTIK